MKRLTDLCHYLIPFIGCFLLLSSSITVAQAEEEDNPSFDSSYKKAYGLMSSDVQTAFRLADSLLSQAQNDIQRMNTLMLLAHIQQSRGEISSSMYYIIRAQRVAKLKGAPDWIARTSGFLATVYRNYGLMEESKKCLAEAEAANEKQKDKPAYALTRINIEQEKALLLLSEDKFEEAIPYLQQADRYVDQVEGSEDDPRTIITKATVYQLLGFSYSEQGIYAKSQDFLVKSLTMLGEQESNLRPYIYRTQAENYLALGEPDSAWHYMQLAEPYISTSESEELKINMYTTYVRYYKAKKDSDKAMFYSELLQETTAARMTATAEITNQLIDRLNKEKQFALLNIKLFWVLGALVVLAGGIGVYLLLRSRKREVARFRDLLTEIEHKHQEQQELLKEMQLNSFSIDKHVAADTEKRLLYALVKLELNNFFLNPDVSSTTLARDLGTNIKYVAYLLRKYRKSDFNDYIQYQRVMYISNRLRNEQALWDYKLSYLAELSGFPTHSMFSVAFKNVTGITPSSFIEYVRQHQDFTAV